MDYTIRLLRLFCLTSVAKAPLLATRADQETGIRRPRRSRPWPPVRL